MAETKLTNLLRQEAADREIEPQNLLGNYASYLRIIAQSQLDRRLHRRVSPSDVVQETLLEAHRDLASFRGGTEAELLAWLRRILVNNLIEADAKHLKTEKRDMRREVYFQQVHSSVERSGARLERFVKTNSDSPSQILSQQEQVVQLSDALNELSAEYRQVIVLRHVDGLGFNQIAEIMDRSSGACRMLWLRAMESLRKKLKAADGP